MSALCSNARRRSGYRVVPCETWIAEAIADLLLASPPQANSPSAPQERCIPTQASV
jgi:hypothetical protein